MTENAPCKTAVPCSQLEYILPIKPISGAIFAFVLYYTNFHIVLLYYRNKLAQLIHKIP